MVIGNISSGFSLRDFSLPVAQKFHASIRYPLGDPQNPLSWEQLEARFHELVAPVIEDRQRREQMIEKVRGLDNLERLVWE